MGRIPLMEGGRTHLHLVLDLGGEPISGRVGAEDAETHGFTGYMGLIAVLQSIRAAEAASPQSQCLDGEAEER
jgi:hypothetical protein